MSREGILSQLGTMALDSVRWPDDDQQQPTNGPPSNVLQLVNRQGSDVMSKPIPKAGMDILTFQIDWQSPAGPPTEATVSVTFYVSQDAVNWSLIPDSDFQPSLQANPLSWNGTMVVELLTTANYVAVVIGIPSGVTIPEDDILFVQFTGKEC